MYEVTVTVDGGHDAWGTLPDQLFGLPAFGSLPSIDDVKASLIAHRIKGRIKTVTVRHIMLARTVARWNSAAEQIVSV
jgi:hypothetical protein